MTLTASAAPPELCTWFSTFTRYNRVLIWIFCFAHRTRKKTSIPPHPTAEEVSCTETLMFRLSQELFHSVERKLLARGPALPNSHPLAGLQPYLSPNGLMRVGGRIQKADLNTDTVHPIILSAKSWLTLLLVRHVHTQALHLGPSTSMAFLTSKCHIPRLRRLVRKVSRDCVICHKVYARTLQRQMGELPAAHVRPSPPFSTVGIDYTGPIPYKRGNPLMKTYMAVFVCFDTKAIHLELVTDLRTDTFLASLHRFIGRRGMLHCIYSDNGTNFVGAQRELAELYAFLQKQATEKVVADWTSVRGIEWQFSPSRAPHFGGLWEAAVRCMKTILRKVVGSYTLTYEELETVLVQAEATLNSRPLVTPDCQEADGTMPLTPGYFLVGRPLLALPTRSDSTKITHLRRWNLVQRLSDNLWKRWQTEYLQSLQQRTKWRKDGPDIQIRDVVLRSISANMAHGKGRGSLPRQG